jgi:hypothetical protein
VEIICKDCKGTSYEYGETREDYFAFCQKQKDSEQLFEASLKLNKHYEADWM